jgi:hypothetical protein
LIADNIRKLAHFEATDAVYAAKYERAIMPNRCHQAGEGDVEPQPNAPIKLDVVVARVTTARRRNLIPLTFRKINGITDNPDSVPKAWRPER